MLRVPTQSFQKIALFRALTLMVSGFFSLSGANAVLGHYGLRGFAQYSILIALVLFFNFADFGFGLNLLKLSGRGIGSVKELTEAFSNSFRMISLSSLFLGSLVFCLCFIGFTTTMLGIEDPNLNWSIFMFLGIALAGTPFKLSYSVLYGTAKSTTVLTLQFISSILLWVFLLIATNLGMNFAMLISLASVPQFMTQVAGYLIVRKHIIPSGVNVNSRFKWQVPKSALPYVGLLALLPLPIEFARISLNHFSGALEVSQFGLLFIFFNAALSVMQSAGPSMTARYVALDIREQCLFLKISLKNYFILGILGAFGLGTLPPLIIDLFMNQKFKFRTIDLFILSFLFFIYCLTYPLAMYLLTSTKQINFLVFCAALNIILVILSIYLGRTGLGLVYVLSLINISYISSTVIPIAVRTFRIVTRGINPVDFY